MNTDTVPVPKDLLEMLIEGAEGSHFYFDERMDQARALLERPPQPDSAWQPIMTAPKDGTYIDCHNGSQRFTNVYWSSAKRRFEFRARDGSYYDTEATHWMPVPNPPTT